MTARKVLVVDDSSTQLLALKDIVREAGCSVSMASSGTEAVTKAKSEQPDLIFMDIIMDDMDGYKACRTLMSDPDTKEIPVVFVSTKHQKADRIWAERQGGRDLITKPYSKEQILEQIERY